jgi:hypothetical protein
MRASLRRNATVCCKNVCKNLSAVFFAVLSDFFNEK